VGSQHLVESCLLVQSIYVAAKIECERDERQHCNPIVFQFQLLPSPSVAQRERALELRAEIVVTDLV